MTDPVRDALDARRTRRRDATAEVPLDPTPTPVAAQHLTSGATGTDRPHRPDAEEQVRAFLTGDYGPTWDAEAQP